MESGHANKLRLPVRWALVVSLVCLAAWRPPAAAAADPTVEALQDELRRVFPLPPPVPAMQDRGLQVQDPFAIVQKEYLWAAPMEQAPTPRRVSLRQIRSYAAPLRQTHAACVKIITPYWHGAGVLISPSGDVLTSYHLLAGAPSVTVQTLDGRLYPVTNAAAFSAVHDLGLVRISGGPFVCLPVAPPAPPAAGQALSIVGHPGEVSWKLSSGTVIRRNADAGTDVLHFDSDIGRGNSGGPIVDESGRLLAITACAAKLADGSSVKIGVPASTIATFLAAPPNPASFADLGTLERNRRVAEFLRSLYVLMGDWMESWAAGMGNVALAATPGRDPGPGPRVALRNLERPAAESVTFLLLRSLMARCSAFADLDPGLRTSMDGFSGMLNHLVDCTTALGAAGGRSAGEIQQALAEARRHRTLAATQFGKALTRLDEFAARTDPAAGEAYRSRRWEALEKKYAPAGCHVDLNGPEG